MDVAWNGSATIVRPVGASAIADTGLSSRQDLVLLGAYVLQIHPRLTLHPNIQRAISSVLAGHSTLHDALNEIPDPEGWDRIRAELMATPPVRSTEFDKEVIHG